MKILKSLPCGCAYISSEKQTKWKLCEVASKLLIEAQGNFKLRPKYDNHFKQLN